MCRIVGIKKLSSKIDPLILDRMRDTLSHGGPDAANVYINEDRSIGLGHRRLSILDLSEAGNQPMYYKQWVLIFNGEIYNFQEIKDELTTLGVQFTTGTDTEMLLKAFEVWGYDCVDRFRGMFAFALWDKTEKKLILCRDRVGVKPLYFYQKDGLFMFASELKAFHEHPDFDKTINHEAVSIFLQQGSIHSPHCIFKHVRKVEPGSYLILNQSNELTVKKYWDIEEVYNNTTLHKGSEEEIIEELEPILKESFQYRMVADVPVGMFLSGGIDSSIVTAMLQKESNTQLKTFTIGFNNPKYDEGIHAKAVSKHIGTDHTELYCVEKDFETLVPQLPSFYDEPLGAGSSIPTYLVSQLAKEKVKVSLSADGGDEIFGGYTKYEIAKNVYSKISKVPSSVRKLSSKLLSPISPSFVDKNLSQLPLFKNYTNIGTKYFKFKNALGAESLLDFFNISSSYISKGKLAALYPYFLQRISSDSPIHKDRVLSYLGMIDFKTFLEGEVMPKVDRATMRVALEGREPFLDQHIIEFGMSIPDHFKIKGSQTKYILRKILYKYVPQELIERPKQGFDIPMREWTNGFLKEEILAMADDASFLDTFEFKKENFKTLIADYYNDKSQIDPHFVWYLYVLYKWNERWIKN